MGNQNKLPDVLSVEQLVKLFDTVEDPKIAIATAVTFFCGLRISEICKLKVEDIDLENKKLKVVDSKFSMRTKTKYGKDRYVVIPDMIIEPIKRWLDIIQGGKWFDTLKKRIKKHPDETLQDFVKLYNNERIHHALAYKTPEEVYMSKL